MESQQRILWLGNKIGANNDKDVNAQKSHKAWKWPFNLNTQTFTPKPPKVSLVGNPFVYGVNLVALVFFIVSSLISNIRTARSGGNQDTVDHNSTGYNSAKRVFLAYVLHYAPFFLMSRTLYIHHYYPALYFSCLLTGVIIDMMIRLVPGNFVKVRPSYKSFCFTVYTCQEIIRVITVISVFMCSASLFTHFSPLVFGIMESVSPSSPESSYHHLHWIDSWNL